MTPAAAAAAAAPVTTFQLNTRTLFVSQDQKHCISSTSVFTVCDKRITNAPQLVNTAAVLTSSE
jgi:hypothetical protein